MEINVVFAVYGDQMDVCVGYFEPQNHYRYPFAGYFAPDFGGDLLGEEHHARKCLVVEVENVVYLLLGYDQRMPFGERIDVQKCVVIRVFGYFVGRNLAGDDA